MGEKHGRGQFQLALIVGDDGQRVVMELFVDQGDEAQLAVIELVIQTNARLKAYPETARRQPAHHLQGADFRKDRGFDLAV